MKKYLVALLIALGLGFGYYATQHIKAEKQKKEIEKVQEEEKIEGIRTEIKAKIGELDALSEEAKKIFLNRLDEAKDISEIEAIYFEARKEQAKIKINGLANLSEEAKKEFLNRLDGAKDISEIEAIYFEARKEQAKIKINELANLSEEAKKEFLSRLDGAKDVGEIEAIYFEARKEQAKMEINGLANLSEEAKKEFLSRLDGAKNIDEIDLILSEVKENLSKLTEGMLTVNFAFDSWKLSKESKEKIKNLVKEQKLVEVSIVGHTDLIGTEKYNQGLSEKRAKAVYNYLVNKLKVDVEIKYSGKGELEPVSDLNRENRRAEIKILY